MLFWHGFKGHKKEAICGYSNINDILFISLQCYCVLVLNSLGLAVAFVLFGSRKLLVVVYSKDRNVYLIFCGMYRYTLFV